MGSRPGTALKAAAMLALASTSGGQDSDDGPSPSVTAFRTGGAAENTAILRANERLGFTVDERWLTLAAPPGVQVCPVPASAAVSRSGGVRRT